MHAELIIYTRNYDLLAVHCWGEGAQVNVPVVCETHTHISYIKNISKKLLFTRRALLG
jgi:hypothetical protein